MRWRGGAAVAVAVVGGALAFSEVVGRRGSLLLATIVAVAVVLTWDRPRNLSWIAGAMLPIMVIDGVPKADLELLHVALIGLVVLRVPRDVPEPVQRLIWTFGALLLALVAARLSFGLVREAFLPTVRYAGLTLLTVIVSVLVASRPRAHRPLLLGHLAGTTISSVVAIMQALGIEWIRTGFHGEGRAPGLAFQAPGLSWHIAIALLVGIAVLVTSDRPAIRLAIGGQMAICSIAALVCGAQGGLGGLLFAALVCGLRARGHLTHLVRPDRVRPDRRTVLITAGGVGIVLVVAFSIGLSSLRGILGDPDKGYENELARLRSIEYGVAQLVDQPLTGAGVDAYDARYDVRPHFIPLDASVTTGVIGLLIGSALFGLLVYLVARRPVDVTPSTMLGLAMLATMVIHALLTPSGPFSAVERITILLIGLVMLRGASVPFAVPRRSRDDELVIHGTER